VIDHSDSQRDAIHAAIQHNRPAERGPALLVGWALVCEWLEPDGEKVLSRMHSSSLPHWGAQGLHHEALYGDWSTDE
jgi:hypothetical protein